MKNELDPISRISIESFERNKTDRIQALCEAYKSAVSLELHQSSVNPGGYNNQFSDRASILQKLMSELSSACPIYLSSDES